MPKADMKPRGKKTKYSLGGILPLLLIAALISTILLFLSYFSFMTVYTTRTYTYYWDTGVTVPNYDVDPYRQTCKEWTRRKTFPDNYWRLENRMYLCYKPNMLAGATALPLIVIEKQNGEDKTLFEAYEKLDKVLLWQWLYAFVISVGIVWICQRFWLGKK